MASYIAKNDQTRPGDFTGRYWGTFAKKRLPVGELHTLELTPQQGVRVRRLARKKRRIDIERRRWRQFFKNINPRQPAPGPEYGILIKHPAVLGNRLWWEQLKSAHHGGRKGSTPSSGSPANGANTKANKSGLSRGFAIPPPPPNSSPRSAHPHAPNPATSTTSVSSATPRLSSMPSNGASNQDASKRQGRKTSGAGRPRNTPAARQAKVANLAAKHFYI